MATGRVPTTANSPLTAKGDLFGYSTTQARVAVGNDGETLVANSSTSTGLAYAPSGLTQPIINGAFDIAQRGTTTGTMNTTFLLDRWLATTSSGVGTQAQVAGLTVGTEVFRYAWQFTALGSFTFMQMGTQIEFANCYQLQNQQVTISFYAQANNANAASTALIVRTRTGATVDGSVLFSGTNSQTSQTITTTPTRYTITKTLPATFGALSLEFVLGTTGTTGDGFTITGVQIDKGSVALPFRRAGGTIQGELDACQRYFEKNTGTIYSICANAAFADSYANSVFYKVEKRTTPTLTIFSSGDQTGTSGSATWYASASGVPAAAAQESNTTTNFTIRRAGVNTAAFVIFSFSSSAEL